MGEERRESLLGFGIKKRERRESIHLREEEEGKGLRGEKRERRERKNRKRMKGFGCCLGFLGFFISKEERREEKMERWERRGGEQEGDIYTPIVYFLQKMKKRKENRIKNPLSLSFSLLKKKKKKKNGLMK